MTDAYFIDEEYSVDLMDDCMDKWHSDYPDRVFPKVAVNEDLLERTKEYRERIPATAWFTFAPSIPPMSVLNER